MSLDALVRAVHVLAVIVYLGGGLFLHLSVRAALRLVPPGQASILGDRLGRDFTWISWASLAAWGATGYWMLFSYGWGEVAAPFTLFVDPGALGTARGVGLLIMIAAWYLLVVSAAVITFVLRPRLTARLAAGTGTEEVQAFTARMVSAVGWIDRLALVNLVLASVGFIAGAVIR